MKSGLQKLFPEMTFSCNGSINKWIYGAIATEESSWLTLPWPEFQMWRFSSPLYTKIGFSLVDIRESTMIGINLYELTLQTPLEFREGDIFGIYSSDRLSLLEQKNNGPVNKYLNLHLIGPVSTVSEQMLSRSSRNNNFPLVTPVISVSGNFKFN